MKTKYLVLVLAVLFVPSFATAGDIVLPPDVDARASVIRSDRDGLWEKTLVVRFSQRRRVLSTNDGAVDVVAAANHAAHPLLWERVGEAAKTHVGEAAKTHDGEGGKLYVSRVREKTARLLGARSEDIAMMATAADMDNLAVVTRTFKPFVVTVLTTAGARGNALRTGVDEGTYIEPDPSEEAPSKAGEPKQGTINILVLTNARMTDGGMARAIITATEAKTAALEDLHVPSTYTKGVQATGTGTDSMIIVSGTSGPRVTYPGGHSRIGEIMGKAVYEAVVEALEKQNGFKRDAEKTDREHR